MSNENKEESNHPKEWLRISDIAKSLSVSTSTVRNWISAGDLSVKRFGRLVIIHRSELEKFLERGTDSKQ